MTKTELQIQSLGNETQTPFWNHLSAERGEMAKILHGERQVPLHYNKTRHCKYPFWVTINAFASKYHQGNPKELLTNSQILKDKVASSLQTGFTLKT